MHFVFLVAHGALYGSLRCVDQQVRLQVRLARETAVTPGTPERPFIKVGGLVFLARASVSKDLPTVAAFERSLPCVYVHMISERLLISKLLPTVSAQNRPLLRGMQNHVAYEKLFLAEFLPTDGAHDRAATGATPGLVVSHQLFLIPEFVATEGTLQ